jgi:hypothetical protein
VTGLPSWFNPDNDADWDQVELEQAGRDIDRAMRRMLAHYDAGRLDQAAAACPHGWEYPLDSHAARKEKDPATGEDGHRCIYCGSRLADSSFDTRNPRVLVACEIKPERRG